jgi:very-short-patch-repair endonuclease
MVCDKKFIDNNGGKFTAHLIKEHNMTIKDYVVSTQYFGKPPKCKCGFCQEDVDFVRGAFSKNGYAKRHNTFSWKIENYIKLFGFPKCKVCGKDSKFVRGVPKFVCEECNKEYVERNGEIEKRIYAFRDYEGIQQKIEEVLLAKYGVSSVMKVPEFVERQKQSAKTNGKERKPTSEDTRKLNSTRSVEFWNRPGQREKMSAAIKLATNTPEEKKRRSEQQKKNFSSAPHKYILKNTLSKLHVNIRQHLDLDSYGFVSEQVIGGYVVDELLERCKVVIEINGDYVHANPKKYNHSDLIVITASKPYTAFDKWQKDAMRKSHLESLGYKVFVLWESDLLEGVLEEKFISILEYIISRKI